MAKLTYLDFAVDELQYFVTAYNAGLRYNAMVSQAQRICECYLKHIIVKSLLNSTDVMMSHNLRTIYDYVNDTLHTDLSEIRSDVMLLNNFYTHTRYPGREAFMASKEDIESAFTAIGNIVRVTQRYL